MTREEIVEKVKITLSEEFDVEQELIVPDAFIYDTLEMDSLTLTELVSILHYTLKIKIPITDLPGIRTFNDLYDYIESHM
jgi:acyl carrier protein